ncbi:hypothetical protein, partial [Mesorhizobium sp. ES1-6]|uniref:hypothetical protein n=1 Tax=Mesorhizobium sp. ES1-6 TaxID=2876626 RepID=UPI001CCAAB4D
KPPNQVDLPKSDGLPICIIFPGQPCVNGEKEAGGSAGRILATLAIGESGDDSVLLPVYGEKMAAAR